MKRATVKLPDNLDAQLRHEAARRRKSVSELIREAISAHLSNGCRRILLAPGVGGSGQTDISETVEGILCRELVQQRHSCATLGRLYATSVMTMCTS